MYTHLKDDRLSKRSLSHGAIANLPDDLCPKIEKLRPAPAPFSSNDGHIERDVSHMIVESSADREPDEDHGDRVAFL
jgi:hypothetical protein